MNNRLFNNEEEILVAKKFNIQRIIRNDSRLRISDLKESKIDKK